MLLNKGDLVQMRKPHPCGSDKWVITRTGTDIKIKCEGCGAVVMMERPDFERKCKKIISKGDESND